MLILIVWSIRLFLLFQNTGILGDQIAEHVCKAPPFVNRSDVCDKDHLRVPSLLQVNKAAVDALLSEYVDHQQTQATSPMGSNPEKLREDIVYALLETILENNWWDTYDGLKKQGVAEEYRP